MRIAILILGLTLAAAWVLVDASTLNWAYKMTKSQAQQQSGEDIDRDEIRELAKGPPIKRWWNARGELNDTFNTSYLSDARGVRMEVRLPLDALLAEGEALPEEVFREVYAAARAPQHLISLCPELLSTIEKKCDLTRPAAKIDRDGLAKLSGSLRFVPRDEPGTLPEAKDAEMINLRVSLTQGQTVAFTPENRQEVLRLTRNLCNRLRVLAGNCVITRVSLMPRRASSRDDAQVLDAGAVLTVYGQPSQIDKAGLEDAMAYVLRSVKL